MSNQSNLASLLTPHNISLQANISSKKKLLEHTAKVLASASGPDMDQKTAFHLLVNREKVGNTGIGEGIALPHSRTNLIQSPTLSIITLSTAVDYDSIDRQPVDVAFGLLVPEDAEQHHLNLLSEVASLLRVKGRKSALTRIEDIDVFLTTVKAWLNVGQAQTQSAAS